MSGWTFGAWLRLVLSLSVLLLAALAVITPFTNLLWKLSIPIKEGGHFLVLPILAFGIWLLLRTGSPARISGLVLVAAGLLFASPLFRAWRTASRLEASFATAFPGSPGPDGVSRSTPLSLRDLFLGIRYPEVPSRTLVYATHDSVPRHPGPLQLDFHPASIGKPAPCVVIVHGGGWDGGNREQLPEINSWLASRGYAVASLDYRRAPEYRYPAPLDDTRDALAWLKAHARELGIDSTRFILLGRSAGGQIALQAAYALQDPSVKAVISYYAPADMVMGYGLPVNEWIMDSRLLMENYLGGTLDAVPAAFHGSSPVETVDSTHRVPTLLLHGRPDVLVAYEHTRRLEARLGVLGETHFTVDLPWAAHGYDYLFSGPGSQISLYFLERFLAALDL